MTRDRFPLPALGLKLAGISQELHAGRGFSVIRGLEPARYSVEDLTTVWLGIQAYIAELRGRQDHRGNILGWRAPVRPETTVTCC